MYVLGKIRGNCHTTNSQKTGAGCETIQAIRHIYCIGHAHQQDYGKHTGETLWNLIIFKKRKLVNIYVAPVDQDDSSS